MRKSPTGRIGGGWFRHSLGCWCRALAPTAPMRPAKRNWPSANDMALPPHWMDQDIADSIDPKAIATRIGEDREFIKIMTKALKSAQDNPAEGGERRPDRYAA